MRGLLLTLLLVPAAPTLRAQEDEETQPIQRQLADLRLGDKLETVKRLYPPLQEWPSYVEPRGRVRRYRVEPGWAKRFPAKVSTLYLGFRRGRLVEMQIVYDAKSSREKTYEELAVGYSLLYGEGQRSGERFWWADGDTVLRVFQAEVPVLKDGAKAVEFRAAVQVYEKGVSESVDSPD